MSDNQKKQLNLLTYAFIGGILLVIVMYAWNSIGISERTYNVEHFNSIHAGGLMNVYITKGEENKVTIRMDDKFIHQSKVKVVERELQIYTDGFMRGERVTDAFVTFSGDLVKISCKEAAKINCTEKLFANKLDLFAEGAAELIVHADTDSLLLNMNDNANVQLAGKANYFAFSISHLGDLMAYNLEAKHCVAKIITGTQSSGIARVFATKTLNVIIKGPRYLYYKGEPEITNSKIEGGGKLLK